MTYGPWLSPAEFEAWWKSHGREFRRLSVSTAPEDYETITSPEWLEGAAAIERFQAKRYLDF